jgi:hypothetical protein
MTYFTFLSLPEGGNDVPVVTLSDARPPARVDGLPWTRARMDQAPAAAGAWTALETWTLEDVDADPALPAARSFTSALATLDAGWYRLVWLDAGDRMAAEQPQLAGPPYMPALDDVARAMLSRIRDGFGNALETFTDETTPTAEQVGDFIVDAADFLSSRVGLDVSMPRRRTARRVCALRAAVLAERAVARGKETQRAKDLATTFDEELAALLDSPGATPIRYRRGSIRTPTIYTERS